MKKPVIIICVIGIAVLGLVVLNYVQTPRLNVEQIREAEEVKQRLEQNAQVGSPAPRGASEGGSRAASEAQEPVEACPDVFQVKFDCSAGTFIAEFHKEWAPLGVQRVYELVKSGFFDQTRFFRVVKGFMVQFGMAGNPKEQATWERKPLGVEEVKQSNVRGAISFAMRGSTPIPKRTNQTRTTQLFINFGDNQRLDAMGFAPVGKVIEGMDVVDRLYADYGESPDQNQIKERGNQYLEHEFPNLDFIKSATILPMSH